MEKHPMTVTGKMKLEAELKNLLQVERPATIRAIEEARGHGDLSENADYDAAKEKQAFIESRISEIQSKLAVAEVVDTSTIKSDKIVFGATVHLIDLETDKSIKYKLVGIDEANIKQGLLSIFSPLGRAMVGKKIGDIIEFSSPKGEKEYEVKKFEFL